jgi:hypothetical protein
VAVEITEPLAWRGLQGASERSKPGTARELVKIRTAGSEVDLDGGCRVARGSRIRRDGSVGDGRRATRASVKVPLGDQLVIRLDDDAPRDAELGRQRAR